MFVNGKLRKKKDISKKMAPKFRIFCKIFAVFVDFKTEPLPPPPAQSLTFQKRLVAEKQKKTNEGVIAHTKFKSVPRSEKQRGPIITYSPTVTPYLDEVGVEAGKGSVVQHPSSLVFSF